SLARARGKGPVALVKPLRLIRPIVMNSVELGNPASKKVGCVSASALGKLEKSWTWLHVAALVSDDGRKHVAASSVFCLGDLTEEVSEPRIVLCDADGVNVRHQLRVWNPGASAGDFDELCSRFLFRRFPRCFIESVFVHV